jgi:hypothetical protein
VLAIISGVVVLNLSGGSHWTETTAELV